MKDSINDYASKHLGQSGSYAVSTDTFDPTLLVAMPRDLARKDWGITGKEFVGVDTWHCHEATFLLNNGLPVAGTLKVIYDASSEFMVESKSIKLYINSFDMCKMGYTIKEAKQNYQEQVKKDLSELLKTNVEVYMFLSDKNSYPSSDPGFNYVDIYKLLSPETLENIEITDYSAEKKHLVFMPYEEDSYFYLTTNILRSRCRHTKQKDTGTAFFYIKTKKSKINIVSLLKEIVSLREVNEFHEFCAEKLYTELVSHPEVEECCVMLLYSRRGSWDINPVRASSYELIPKVMVLPDIYTTKQMGQ